MTLPASGAISINSLVGEYGGSGSHSLSEYYKGGSFVANHSNNANVPTSGTISLSNFHGQDNTNPVDNVASFSGDTGLTRGVLNGYGTNTGYCDSEVTGYMGIAYGDGGSSTDGNLQVGNNSTVRMITGAVGAYEVKQLKGLPDETTYMIEIMFAAHYSGQTLQSGATGYPLGHTTLVSELQNKKILINDTQYAHIPNASNWNNNNQGLSTSAATTVGGTNDELYKMNGIYSHRVRIIDSHSSTGSTTITGSAMAEFDGNFTVKITT